MEQINYRGKFSAYCASHIFIFQSPVTIRYLCWRNYHTFFNWEM